jgi:hypothetical protein
MLLAVGKKDFKILFFAVDSLGLIPRIGPNTLDGGLPP